MTRFRPSVESLDARTLPSAVFAASDEPVAVVTIARETTPPAKPPAKPPTPPITITLSDALVSNYQ